MRRNCLINITRRTTKMSTKIKSIAAVAAASALALGGLVATAPAEAGTPTITVATEGTYAPFSYHATARGPLTGYDVEVFKAVAKKAGIKVVFKETTWDGIFAGLEAGRWDAIANQVTITDARKALYTFTVPYTSSSEVVVTRKNDNRVTRAADVSGKTAAQTATSNHHDQAVTLGANVEVVPGFTESLALLSAGRVDLTLNDRLAVLDYLKHNRDANLKIAATLPGADLEAIVFKKGYKYATRLNNALKALKKSGAIAKIGKKYFGSDVSK
jgi:cystine transport system substrate-binding protein